MSNNISKSIFITINTVLLTALIFLTSKTYAEDKRVPAIHDSRTIIGLPSSGQAEISGVITEIKNNRIFVLQDMRGDSLDIKTMEENQVHIGDKVTVDGNMGKKMFGMGRIMNNAAIGHSIANNNDSSVHSALIKDLPRKGNVEISGKVKNVKTPNKFVLEDNTGDTININADRNVNVRPGDMVNVQGEIGSKAFGLVEQIQASQINKL